MGGGRVGVGVVVGIVVVGGAVVVVFGPAVLVVVGVVGATVVAGKSAEQMVSMQREKTERWSSIETGDNY